MYTGKPSWDQAPDEACGLYQDEYASWHWTVKGVDVDLLLQLHEVDDIRLYKIGLYRMFACYDEVQRGSISETFERRP
ncbi:MAG: hypothetical protein ACRC8W_15075 [Plesiomonas shigelloides]